MGLNQISGLRHSANDGPVLVQRVFTYWTLEASKIAQEINLRLNVWRKICRLRLEVSAGEEAYLVRHKNAGLSKIRTNEDIHLQGNQLLRSPGGPIDQAIKNFSASIDGMNPSELVSTTRAFVDHLVDYVSAHDALSIDDENNTAGLRPSIVAGELYHPTIDTIVPYIGARLWEVLKADNVALDEKFHKNCDDVIASLEVPSNLNDHVDWDGCGRALNGFDATQIPSEKLEKVAACLECLISSNANHGQGEVISADDLVPAMIFLVASNGGMLQFPNTAVAYIRALLSPSSLVSERGYHLTTLESAILYISYFQKTENIPDSQPEKQDDWTPHKNSEESECCVSIRDSSEVEYDAEDLRNSLAGSMMAYQKRIVEGP